MCSVRMCYIYDVPDSIALCSLYFQYGIDYNDHVACVCVCVVVFVTLFLELVSSVPCLVCCAVVCCMYVACAYCSIVDSRV